MSVKYEAIARSKKTVLPAIVSKVFASAYGREMARSNTFSASPSFSLILASNSYRSRRTRLVVSFAASDKQWNDHSVRTTKQAIGRKVEEDETRKRRRIKCRTKKKWRKRGYKETSSTGSHH